MGKSRLKLELTTAAGTDLNDFVRIELVSAQDSNHYQANLRVARSVVIEDIEANPSTVYRVTVMPSNHRIVQFFAMLREGLTAEQTVACPVDPARVTSLQAPSYEILAEGARELLAHSEIPRFSTEDGAFLQGLELYRALDSTPKLKACLLNIITKSAATVLRTGFSPARQRRCARKCRTRRCFTQSAELYILLRPAIP